MTIKRLKILHVTYESPHFPGGSGGQTRQFNLLRYLSERHDIDYVGPAKSVEELAVLQKLFRSVMIPKENFFLRQAGSLAKRINRGYPSCVLQHEKLRVLLMPLVKKALHRNAYDIINVEHTNIAHWLASTKTSAKKILVAHNVKTVMWERYLKHCPESMRNKLYLDHRKLMGYETKNLNSYDRIITMSETDKGYIHELCGKELSVNVVPNGVDIEYFAPSGMPVDQSRIVFTGSMNHPPNDEGIRYFCREIFPRIRAEEPQATLLIVGNSPSKEVQALADGNRIKVTGFVPDTRPYVASAAVIVAPLLTGSGTRLKILEAMAMGKAIVSTSLGAEGIDCTHGENILLADTPEEFSARVLGLMANQNNARNLGLKARKAACEKYSWKHLSLDLEVIYRSCSEG